MDRDREAIIVECAAAVIAKWQFYVGRLPDDARQRIEKAISEQLPWTINKECPPHDACVCRGVPMVDPVVAGNSMMDGFFGFRQGPSVEEMVAAGVTRLV